MRLITKDINGMATPDLDMQLQDELELKNLNIKNRDILVKIKIL